MPLSNAITRNCTKLPKHLPSLLWIPPLLSKTRIWIKSMLPAWPPFYVEWTSALVLLATCIYYMPLPRAIFRPDQCSFTCLHYSFFVAYNETFRINWIPRFMKFACNPFYVWNYICLDPFLAPFHEFWDLSILDGPTDITWSNSEYPQIRLIIKYLNS